MTCKEFSNEFDILLNSYRALNKYIEGNVPNTINLNEYEKSIFLTQAQEDLILLAYDGINPLRESFEGSEKIRKYLNELVRIKELDVEGPLSLSMYPTYWSHLPEDDEAVWFTIYEEAELENDRGGSWTALVKPVTHDEFFYTIQNPFKSPNKKRVLRLDISSNKVELIANQKYIIKKYIIRYISKPAPIILVDLSKQRLTIGGKSEISECNLNPAIHRAILERAVQLAYQSRANISNE